MSGFMDHIKGIGPKDYLGEKKHDVSVIGFVQARSTSDSSDLPGKEININDSMKDSKNYILYDDAIDNCDPEKDRTVASMHTMIRTDVGRYDVDLFSAETVDPVEKKLSELESNTTDLQNKVEFLEYDILTKDARINTLESLIFDIQSIVDMLEIKKDE